MLERFKSGAEGLRWNCGAKNLEQENWGKIDAKKIWGWEKFGEISIRISQTPAGVHTRVGQISLFLKISKRLVLYVWKIERRKSCQNFRTLDQYLHLPQAK